MRVLVVGTTPPPGGASACALGAVAAQLVGNGDEVEILSPDARSAAHRHSRLAGLLLSAQLVRFARRFDAVVLRVEPGLPLRPTAGRVARAANLIVLGLALRFYQQVTVRLDSPVPIPGGLGGRGTELFWKQASSIVVANEQDAQNLRKVRGIDATRIEVEALPELSTRVHFEGWAVDPAGNLREEVSMLVRERVARDRLVAGAHAAMGGEVIAMLSASGLVDARPTNPSISGIARFGVAKARRVAKRLLASSKD